MKKIYLSMIVVVATAFSGLAQSFNEYLTIESNDLSVGTKAELPTTLPSVAAADPTDTLGWAEFGDAFYVWESSAGYLSGTFEVDLGNGLDTVFYQRGLEYAAGYDVTGPYNILGALMVFGLKTDASGSPGDLNVNLWSLADNKALAGLASTNYDAKGPDAVLESKALPFSDVVLGNVTTVMFDQSVWVNSDFAISLDIENLYGTPMDSIVLFTDSIGDSDGMYTWTREEFEQVLPSAGAGAADDWFRTNGIFTGVNVHHAIFALAAESLASIEEQGYLNGVKMTTYPNPTVASEDFTIQYGLETSVKNVDINIYNMNGQVVHSATLGGKASGLYNLNIPAGTLSAGSYIYSIDADDRRMAKRLEVLK